MGTQFIHVETYGLQARSKSGKKPKRTIKDIVDEEVREAHACKHVPTPKPLMMVFGERPEEVLKYLETNAPNCLDRTGKRKLPKDAQILLAGVCSAPIESDALTRDYEAYNASKVDGKGQRHLITKNMRDFDLWRKKTLEFLKDNYGENLRSVIIHHDEKYIHMHFLCRNDVKNNTLNLDGIDFAGDISRKMAPPRAERAKKGGAKQLMTARCHAFKAFQQLYYENVAQHLGWSRYGPRKRRLTHEQWKQEKLANEAKARELRASDEKLRQADKALAEASIKKTMAESALKSTADWQRLESEIVVLGSRIQQLSMNPDPAKLAQASAQLQAKAAQLNALRQSLRPK